jgi:hypothetical protein
MNTHEIALAAAKYLRALPATVKVEGSTITMEQTGRTLTIEAMPDETFMIGPQMLHPSGGVQTHVTDAPRKRVNSADLMKRANAWARARSVA